MSLQESRPSKSQSKPADKREKRTGKLNEFVQTDLGKGVADSGQEVPVSYAQLYTVGQAN